jgi:hypothetical protein
MLFITPLDPAIGNDGGQHPKLGQQVVCAVRDIDVDGHMVQKRCTPSIPV